MKRTLSLLIISTFLLTGCVQDGDTNRSSQYSRAMPLMDTFVQVKISWKRAADKEGRQKAEETVSGAFRLADELEKRFDIYCPESEINSLNIARERSVSPALFDLLERSERISRLTSGRFDTTVAPVLKREGFYEDMPDSIREKIPDSPGEGGWKDIILSPESRKVILSSTAWVDLSGIAKGYIVDRMAEFFRENKIQGFLINAGGDIYCGERNGYDKWMIGLREPGTESVLLVLELEDMAVATSGDYENWIMRDTGEVFSHIVDPLRHAAVEKELSSVTVISPSCTEADALATGMMAMRKDKVIALADTIEGVEAIVVTFSGDGYKIDHSGGAGEYIVRRQK